MRKIKIFVGMLAFLAATTIAVAFNNISSKQTLYYYNSNEACVVAPCETTDHTGRACLLIVYTDSACKTQYQGTTWTGEGD